MKNIYKIKYNWHQCADGTESGEGFEVHEVGKNGVVSIELYPNQMGQYAYYEVTFDNGSVEQIFNINQVYRS